MKKCIILSISGFIFDIKMKKSKVSSNAIKINEKMKKAKMYRAKSILSIMISDETVITFVDA
jgi:uncharacterized Rossmann fold enzyme